MKRYRTSRIASNSDFISSEICHIRLLGKIRKAAPSGAIALGGASHMGGNSLNKKIAPTVKYQRG
jgi:hypothetical protein